MLTVLTHFVCLGTKLKILELWKSDFPTVFMAKAVKAATQNLGVDDRKDISLHFGTKIL